MKKFTVKDFITYSGPCFSCRDKISFQIGSSAKNKLQQAAFLIPVVTNDFIDIDLKINYRNGLNLKIFTKTNKFTTSSMKYLTKYLGEHDLFLRSNCTNCRTLIDSRYLEFNILKEFVAPVGIEDERLIVRDDKYLYELYSNFKENEEHSYALVSTLQSDCHDVVKIELPPLPMYKLKNRDRFIQKMKTYILFS